jgi:hypothetical protein
VTIVQKFHRAVKSRIQTISREGRKGSEGWNIFSFANFAFFARHFPNLKLAA